MLATISEMELLTETEGLTDMIIHSETFDEYIQARDELRASTEAQKLINDFNQMKDMHEEVQRFGKYHPDYERVSKEIRQLKRSMDKHELVKAFKDAEKELEFLLNEISGLIAHSVSETIKVPTGNPFFDNMSCSGGCGSGGGCSCG
ncbi:YlbF family regulator [Alkalicoccobacillus plakortidis]|uniref:YlbF family regulator n=1 Tax=Alkalicoccobacillus plakortidis TaxID=444060 RepID=A0ABT0XGM2_9BACI|nr:YlbF family regulator [Alkalicoccobacillus plakortidis]MCM2674845.1 YlbF family regulator [Alkalicoccobacillus plakortidis]